VELAHAGDDGLAGLFVRSDAEGRVLLGELLDGVESFSWSPLVFGSMATSMTGSGKVIDSRTTGASGRTGCHRWWCPSGR
jgi:hypothetical protein